MIHTDGVPTVACAQEAIDAARNAAADEARAREEDRRIADAEWYAEAYHAQWDDDPSPYDGTYSEM